MAGVVRKTNEMGWVGDLVIAFGWTLLGAFDAMKLWHDWRHMTGTQELFGAFVVVIVPALVARRISKLVDAWKVRHP